MLLIAKTFQGLEDVLAKELTDLGALEVTTGTRMVSFKGDKRMLYKANFCCRTALKILKPIVSFKAQDTDELYEEAKKFAWDTLLNVNDTFSIDSTVNSDEFRHSKFVVYRVKDAIADYFSEKFNKRPSIRLVNADIQLNVHIFNNEVTISLDSSGEPLFKRGYRVEQTEAPINEVLAAGLLLKAGWDGQSNLIDPMCGSGTFLIEAALIATGIYPGIFRKSFAFENWKDFEPEILDEIYNDDSNERDFNYLIYGSDISPKAIAISSLNIKSAGVGRYIDLKAMPFEEYTEAPQNGMLITNPPYGERLSLDDIDKFYDMVGNKLKTVFKGYHAWIIAYKPEHFNAIGLKPSVKYPMHNGALECEFREYVIFDGTFADFRKQGNTIKGEKKEKSKDRAARKEWKNQDDRFRREKRFDRNKEEERFERDRRGFRREKPKNALEKEYRKPFGERFKKTERKPSVFGDSKVDRNIKFKKPTLFSAEEYNKEGEITMRHRKRNNSEEND